MDNEIYNYVMFVLIIPISILTYNLIEVKLTNMLKKRFISYMEKI
jgi:hypothetical protein